MVIEFYRYIDLIERPKVFEIVRGNRERLLLVLIEAVETYKKQLDSGEFPENLNTDASMTIHKMYHLKHMKGQVCTTYKILTKMVMISFYYRPYYCIYRWKRFLDSVNGYYTIFRM